MAPSDALLCLLLAFALMTSPCISQGTTPPAITGTPPNASPIILPEPIAAPDPFYASPPATSPTVSSYTPPAVSAPSTLITPPSTPASPSPPFPTSNPSPVGTGTTPPGGSASTVSLEKLAIFGVVLVGGGAFLL